MFWVLTAHREFAQHYKTIGIYILLCIILYSMRGCRPALTRKEHIKRNFSTESTYLRCLGTIEGHYMHIVPQKSFIALCALSGGVSTYISELIRTILPE